MMKMNLLPKEDRKEQKEASGKKLSLFFFLSVSTAICLVVLTGIFYVWLQEQKQYYHDQLQPVLVQLQGHNEAIDRRQEKADHIRQVMEKNTNWPGVLVALAETKPQDVCVRSLTGEKKGFCLTVTCPQNGSLQQWQQRLKQTGWFPRMTLGKVKRPATGPLEMDLHLTISNEHTTPISKAG